MIKRAALGLIVVAALAACGRESAPAPKKSDAPIPPANIPVLKTDEESDNLLSLFAGASLVERDGEMSLGNSAVHAIDGDSGSAWTSIPRSTESTMLYSLGGRARIEQVGAIVVGDKELYLPRTVRFESSLDGRSFAVIGTVTPELVAKTQLESVRPVEARYVRVTIASAAEFAVVLSLQIRGRMLERDPEPSLDGCWTINGYPARFEQRGASVIGAIHDNQTPVFLEGGSSGAFYRFAWTEGPQFGEAALSITPDGQRLSGVRWYREPVTRFLGESLIGERADCGATTLALTPPASTFLRQAKWYPLYGLRFDADDRLLVAESAAALDRLVAELQHGRARLIAHEMHETTAEANHARTKKRVASLREALVARGARPETFELIAAGEGRPWREIVNVASREMFSVIVLDRRQPF